MNFPHLKYGDLSTAAKKRIIEYDNYMRYGPEGEMMNRNRFYTYLTQLGSDVVVRTVAVKAKSKKDKPIVKQVVIGSVDDPYLHMRDVAFYQMGGYLVDWSPEKVAPPRDWSYRGRWDSEAWDRRCMWKIWAPVVNPELLLRTRRFKWCAWGGGTTNQGHIIDYLKTYVDHPEIELLSKAGLGCYASRISVVRKLKKDKAFRQFFNQNMEEIKRELPGVDVMLRSFKRKISFDHAIKEIEARRRFRGYDLSKLVDALKAVEYIAQHDLTMNAYARYIRHCEDLDMDMTDTKVLFPRNFKDRATLMRDQHNELVRGREARFNKALSSKLIKVANEWSLLEKSRGKYCFVIPQSVADFVIEGEALSNCLGKGYASQVARGEIVVAFVRRREDKEKAFVAVAYNLKRKCVTQCYAEYNQRPPDEVTTKVKRAFARVANQERIAA